MDLIQSEQNNVPVEAEPRYVHETASLPVSKTEHGQTWLRTLGVILAAVVLIVLIVLFARWLYHKTHHAVAPAPATSQQQTKSQSSQNAQSGSQAVQNPSVASGTSAPQSSTANNPSLPNGGPGNVVALFIGTSLAAAGLHYIISIRRFSRPSA